MGAKESERLRLDDLVAESKTQVSNDKGMSETSRKLFVALLDVVQALAKKLGTNSSNSSMSPSQDPFRGTRGRKKSKKKSGRSKKPGGQPGHKGNRLNPVSNPDKIEKIKIDRRTLPQGRTYTSVGFDARQVFDIKVQRIVTEYQAEIVADDKGNRYVAEFPGHATRPTQYGASVRAHAVYMSQSQLVPLGRLQRYFSDLCSIPVSQGSLVNFNERAFHLLTPFESMLKVKLLEEPVLQADETGINVDGQLNWLHTVGSPKFAFFQAHENRGEKAMKDIGILPNFGGILCHDHWKPYYKLDCLHSLCNAHHLRELQAVHENDGHAWPLRMKALLLLMNSQIRSGKKLTEKRIKQLLGAYDVILKDGEKQSPSTLVRPSGQTRGRIGQTKARCLLDRLRDFKCDVLRFLVDPLVPFTNNRSENDIRMTKVQQKISGCFRSWQGAHIFCRIRGYMLTCQKHGIAAIESLTELFAGRLPEEIRHLSIGKPKLC